MSVGVYVVSKNNYAFFEKHWWPHMSSCGCPVLNIDEGSDEEQRAIGQKFCEAQGIKYLDRDVPGVQNNAHQAARYFAEQGIKWMLWFQHDCWPIESDFFEKLKGKIEAGDLDEYGTIGFNALATDTVQNHGKHMKVMRKGGRPLGVMARAPLEGYAWYSSYSARPKLYPAVSMNKQYRKPFPIESVAWFAIGVNVQSYLENIQPDQDLRFHLGWDDVCFQFLKQNIYNVALPDLYIEHRPDLKQEMGLPRNSAQYTKNKENNYYFEQAEHLDIWKRKWGFEWGNRKSFGKVVGRYKGTLLERFYNHDPNSGTLSMT
tara:strand:- start:22205 stop:23155 length:951 start_codon:yes stop_codon:yes gene_type:complete